MSRAQKQILIARAWQLFWIALALPATMVLSHQVQDLAQEVIFDILFAIIFVTMARTFQPQIAHWKQILEREQYRS